MLFAPDRQYQIVLGPVPPHATTNGYLYALLHSGGPGNITGHQDAALDILIERQARELDPERRQEQLRDLQRMSWSRLICSARLPAPTAGYSTGG